MKLLETAQKHMERSPYQAFAAILTMFLTFLLSGVFLLSSVASGEVIKFFESKPQITVFFQDKAGDAEAKQLQQKLESTQKISAVKYVSKEEALSIYREQNKSDPLLLELVTADILPASLEISAKNPSDLKDLEPLVSESEGVDEVVYQRDVVESLLVWTRAIRLVGGSLAFVLAINSVLTIMTIIAMRVALKREEIDVLKLVGASPWYIRGPFVVEGGLYGIFGAVVAALLILGLVLWMRPFLFTFLGVVPNINHMLTNPVGSFFVWSAVGFIVGFGFIGFFLGSIGSLVALVRYLKF